MSDEVTTVLGIDLDVDLEGLKTGEVKERFDSIKAAIQPLVENDDLDGAELADKKALAGVLKEARDEWTVRQTDIPVDLEDLEDTPDDVDEEEEEEDVDEGGDGGEGAGDVDLLDEDGPSELTDEERELVNSARLAHRKGKAPKTNKAGLPGGGKQKTVRQPVMRMSTGEAVKPDAFPGLADDYAAAVRSSNETVIYQASQWHEGTEFIDRNSSEADKNRIMGITGPLAEDMNRADACPDERYINDKEICMRTIDDELQEWISGFPMTDTCQVKTKDTVGVTPPTIFEWAYGEADLVTDPTGATKSTGLVQPNGSILNFDKTDESTWKPLTDTNIDCSEQTHRLRSLGFIREIGRGHDICSSDELEQAISMDQKYLAQRQSRSIIAAFDTYATAKDQVHAFDGTNFVNPAAALAFLFGEVLPVKQDDYGADPSQATLVLPSRAGVLFNVARYEAELDNDRYTADTMAEIAGVNGVVTTLGIPVAGGVPSPVPAVIDSTTLGRQRVFSAYMAWRAGWRQGRGVGVRGKVNADEGSARGNKRLEVTEIDQVNIALGCLSVVRFDITLNFTAGHVAQTNVNPVSGALTPLT